MTGTTIFTRSMSDCGEDEGVLRNHEQSLRGQAVVNALEIKATLNEERVVGPAPLFPKYPELIDSAMPEAEDAELRLFE